VSEKGEIAVLALKYPLCFCRRSLSGFAFMRRPGGTSVQMIQQASHI